MYERALQVELQARSVPVQRQVEVPVMHDGVTVDDYTLNRMLSPAFAIDLTGHADLSGLGDLGVRGDYAPDEVRAGPAPRRPR